MNAARSPLTEEENESIFQTQILPEHEPDLRSSELLSPVLVYVAGQSAAGKSTAIDDAHADIIVEHGAALVLQRDLLRDYFPGYEDQLKSYGAEGYKFSEQDTWLWYAKLKKEALARRASLIVESTFRKPEDILADVERFGNAGYRIEVRALAVHPAVSCVGVFTRYEREVASLGSGRFVDPATHRDAITGLLKTVATLEERHAVDKITIQTRTEVLRVIAPKLGESGAARVLMRIHTELSPDEAKAVAEDWNAVVASMNHRSAPSLELQLAERERESFLHQFSAALKASQTQSPDL